MFGFRVAYWTSALGVVLTAGCADVYKAEPDRISAAVGNPLRHERHRARDETRNPASVLRFFGVDSGSVTLDLFSYDGYYTEILSGVVGEEGVVYTFNRDDEAQAGRSPRLEEAYPRFGNIEMILEKPNGGIPLPDDSVDFALFALQLHHYHYDESTPDRRPARADALYAEVQRVLKPGGTFAVIEHKAIDGASRELSASWHRIDRATAIADITGAGFEFVSEAPEILVYPEDDNASFWRETLERGHTNRLVLKFENPF